MISMIAGNDTTAAAIRMTMLSLMTSPRVYSKLKSVVHEAVRDGLASHPIKYEEAKKIPYIQVCADALHIAILVFKLAFKLSD